MLPAQAGHLASRYGTTSSNDSAISDLSGGSAGVRDSRDGGKCKGVGDGDLWDFAWHRSEGHMTVLGEWTKRSQRTERWRCLVLGPRADVPCVLLAVLLLLGPVALMLVYLLAGSVDWQILLGGSAAVSVSLLCSVYLMDPGLVPAHKRAETREWTYCDYCESFRPPACVHCAACGTCISGYDHHCPWTGKCVGNGNRSTFKALTASVTWLALLMFVVVLAFLPWSS